ncbi:MAG: hypothetical protein Q8908_13920 [Bacteroidota bacterium]|nr:hypothetical protein [Bacteroidota bacterium]
MIIVEKHSIGKVTDDFGDKKITSNPVWIYQQGTPRPIRTVCSIDHLKEIIEQGIKYLVENEPGYLPEGYFPAKLSEPKEEKNAETEEGKDPENNAVIEAKNAEIEYLANELNKANAEIKALKNAPVKASANKTSKGGRGRR